ncbi:MAG: hypothetical protein JWP69_515 [Flaviaesturariibacter sp.]|nr:hypothetical protein [Flaviaesturariibacter sp.]
MQKVFRLLRHNNELGPFTIGDLLQQQLTPEDLIWVDGESTAWAHPQEMENLKYAIDVNLLKKVTPLSEVPSAPKKDEPIKEVPKKRTTVWAESPAAELERKAEAIRQRTLAYKNAPAGSVPAWAQDLGPVIPVGDNEVEVVYHKRRALPIPEVLMGTLVIALLTLGWYGGGKDLFQQPKAIANAVAVKLVTTDNNAAIGAPDLPLADSAALLAKADSGGVKDTSYTMIAKTAPVRTTRVAKDLETVPKESPVIAMNTAPSIETKEEVTIKKPAAEPEKMEPEKKETPTIAKSEETPAVEAEERKRGLGKVLKGLFKKKKKDEDKAPDEVKPDSK